jgi:hypothetical protein
MTEVAVTGVTRVTGDTGCGASLKGQMIPGYQVDRKIKFLWLAYRNFARFAALQNLINHRWLRACCAKAPAARASLANVPSFQTNGPFWAAH